MSFFDGKPNWLTSKYYVDNDLNIHHVYVTDPWRAERTKEGYKLFWVIPKAYELQQILSRQTGKRKGRYIEDDDVIIS